MTVNHDVVGSSPTGGVHSYKCLETRRVVRAGRRSTIGNRVGSNPVSRVRIPYSPYFVEFLVWPVGQAVKTPPFHGGNTGSSPVRVIPSTLTSAFFVF